MWQRLRRVIAPSPAALGRYQLALLLPRVSVRLTAIVALLVCATAALPLAFTFASGALIGSIPAAVADGPDSPAARDAIRALLVAAGVFVLQRLIGPLRGIFAAQLANRVEEHLELRLMRAISRPAGIGHLEDPATLDLIRDAQEIGEGQWKPIGAVTALVTLASQWLQGFGFAAVVVGFRWWLGLAFLAAVLYVAHLVRRDYLRTVQVMAGGTRALRRATYLRDLALLPRAAKEVRLFGLVDWIADRHADEWLTTMRSLWRERNRGLGMHVGLALAMALLHGACLFYVGWEAVRGSVSLTELAILVGALAGMRIFGSLDTDTMRLEWGAAAVPALIALERHMAALANGRDASPAAAPGPQHAKHGVPAPAPVRLPGGIRFEGVAFRYPGSAADTLAGLDLDVPAGRSLAVVGANGAGKTTLVKLLCRLYEPQAGRITAGGVPLAEIPLVEWRRRLAAIFQDFVRYSMPARDNVGFGALALTADQQRLDGAAGLAGALDLVGGLPNGWDTILSRQFKGGADLSGGEWQRIALARALFAVNGGADVLILDEPTANLDVRAEAALYDRFLDITTGLTTILISHRFSTVRRAERIVVLDQGRVVEQGSHDELMALGGRYAEMFALQASRFEEHEPAGAPDGQPAG